MKTKILDIDALSSVSPNDVIWWLKTQGWRLAETVGKKCHVYAKTIGSVDFEAAVPYSSSFLDYPRRMSELFDLLEAAEQRPQLQLLEEMRQAGADVLRLRIRSEVTKHGRLPVMQGAQFFAQARDLMLAAACATIEKRPAFSNRKPGSAIEYVRNLKFGPSEQGSYVTTIESPVPPALQMDLLGSDPEPPYERQVMTTLSAALQAAVAAVGEAGAANDILPFVQAVGSGVSANLCYALSGMLEGFDSSFVDLAIGWAHSRPAGIGPVKVTIAQRDAALLKEAARILRERDPQRDFELEGYVVVLESAEVVEGGLVTVAAELDGRLRRVKLRLAIEAYAEALDAHRCGRLVVVKGDLAREGSGWVLQKVRDFQVREEP